MFRRATVVVLALLAATAARAHPEIDDALARLSAQLAAAPDDAALYLARGELYAKHAEWPLAEANYLRAAELSPRLPRLDLAHGALALATGQFADARAFLDRALSATPDDPTALILRARTLAQLRLPTAALADYAVALRLLPSPAPELYLERAALFASPADALSSLDEAIARLGPILTLHLRALALEISLARTDAALARLDQLAAVSENPALYLKRRGDLLAFAGRPAEARAAYARALSAIAALPAWLAQSPEIARLSAELTPLATTAP